MATNAARVKGSEQDRLLWSSERNPLGRALEVVGTRSALAILREAAFGTTRFDDFTRRAGVTESVAAARLRDLVEAGLLERRSYQEPGSRTRQEYLLTDTGAELVPALIALVQWGERHGGRRRGAAGVARHTACGAPVEVEMRCTNGHPVAVDDLTIQFPRSR
jgi:DNA-binding HxlR family transcriptional regulator